MSAYRDTELGAAVEDFVRTNPTSVRRLARLFGGEYDALMVMKLKEVAEELEGAADAFENVADTVETIAVKES